MVVRTVGAMASGTMVTLLMGLAGPGGQVLAQYYPPSQAYPPQQAYPSPQGYPPAQAYPSPQGYPPRPPARVAADDDDDAQFYDPPMVQSQPLPPPAGMGQQVDEPPAQPGHKYGRRAPVYPEQAELPPPPPPGYRDLPPPGYRDLPPPGYRDVPPPGYRDGPAPGYRDGQAPGYRDGPPPGYRDAQPGYRDVPPGYRDAPPGYRDGPQGYEPAAAGTRPYYPPGQGPGYPPGPGMTPAPGAPGPVELDGMRPPMPIGPGQAGPGPAAPGPVHPGATGALRGGDPRVGDQRFAALPPEVRPETGPVKELPPQFRRILVEYRTKEPVGTIIIDTQNTHLYLVLGNGQAMRYGIGVGREGFTWAGAEKVSKMAEWPDWNPPTEMIERQPYLPRFMAGGEGNPLGARALYLGKTLYRIHGTNQPSTIGSFVSSGCIRLTNEDVADLYTRVKVGTRVVVLPGRAPPSATAMPAVTPGGRPMGPPGAPPVSMAPPGLPPAPIAR